MRAEQTSINNRDLFGEQIDGDDLDSYLCEDYDEQTDNPFADFLSHLTAEIGSGSEFEGWGNYGSPYYTICKDEARALVDNDVEAANCVLRGRVQLHKLPTDLGAAATIEWVREQEAQFAVKAQAELELLKGDDLKGELK